MQLTRWACRQGPIAERGLAARGIYRLIAVALQRGNGRMVLEAGYITMRDIQGMAAAASQQSVAPEGAHRQGRDAGVRSHH